MLSYLTREFRVVLIAAAGAVEFRDRNATTGGSRKGSVEMDNSGEGIFIEGVLDGFEHGVIITHAGPMNSGQGVNDQIRIVIFFDAFERTQIIVKSVQGEEIGLDCDDCMSGGNQPIDGG